MAEFADRVTLRVEAGHGGNGCASIHREKVKPLGVGVVVEARHLCMEMRGAQSKNSPTITSSMRGVFREDSRTREEFLTFVNGPRR